MRLRGCVVPSSVRVRKTLHAIGSHADSNADSPADFQSKARPWYHPSAFGCRMCVFGSVCVAPDSVRRFVVGLCAQCDGTHVCVCVCVRVRVRA
jgi:hypothetical protein